MSFITREETLKLWVEGQQMKECFLFLIWCFAKSVSDQELRVRRGRFRGVPMLIAGTTLPPPHGFAWRPLRQRTWFILSPITTRPREKRNHHRTLPFECIRLFIISPSMWHMARLLLFVALERCKMSQTRAGLLTCRDVKQWMIASTNS